MTAWHTEIGAAALPSDYLLQRMGAPWFAVIFQLMILTALLETGVGAVNALNERIDEAARPGHAQSLSSGQRLAISAVMLLGSAFVAARIGLVELIASGYGAFGYIMLMLFVLPLLTLGIARLARHPTEVVV